MLRHRLPGDVESLGDVSGRALTLGDECEHLPAARLGKGLEDIGRHERAQLYTCARERLRRGVSCGAALLRDRDGDVFEEQRLMLAELCGLLTAS